MNVLVLGYSTIFRNRVLAALEKNKCIKHIDIASYTRQPDLTGSTKLRNCYADYQAALTESDADLVYVSVRNHEHVSVARKALQSGKHVIVDKPAALNVADAHMLVDLAAQKNKCIAEALVYHYHPQIEMSRKLFFDVQAEPSHVSVNFTIPGLNAENFRYLATCGGGAINDMAAYAMSVGEQWFGEKPMDCTGYIKSDGHGVETAFSLSLAYPGARTLSGYFGFETEYLNTVTVFSKSMSVQIDRVFTPPADFENHLLVKAANQSRIEKAVKGDTFQLFFEDVVEGIKQNDFTRFSLDLLKNAELLELLNNKLIKL